MNDNKRESEYMVFKFELKPLTITVKEFKCNVKYPQVLLFTFTYNNIKKMRKITCTE